MIFVGVHAQRGVSMSGWGERDEASGNYKKNVQALKGDLAEMLFRVHSMSLISYLRTSWGVPNLSRMLANFFDIDIFKERTYLLHDICIIRSFQINQSAAEQIVEWH